MRVARPAKSTSAFSLIVFLAVLTIVVWGFNFYNSRPKVLGSQTFLSDQAEGSDNNNTANTSESTGGKQESVSQPAETKTAEPTEVRQQTETPEPSETPKPKEVTEPADVPEIKQKTQEINNEIGQQVKNDSLNEIDVEAPGDVSGSGKIVLKDAFNRLRVLSAPVATSTPLTQINTPDAGEVSVRVGGTNNVAIQNGPYTVNSQFPVVIDPKNHTIAIRTPSGIIILNNLPVQAFQNLPADSRLSSVNSINLTFNAGQPTYQTEGVQTRQFLGLVPVSANVVMQINAQTGQVVSTKLPWYFSLFGFAFKTI